MINLVLYTNTPEEKINNTGKGHHLEVSEALLFLPQKQINKPESKTMKNYDRNKKKGNPIYGLLVSIKREPI